MFPSRCFETDLKPTRTDRIISTATIVGFISGLGYLYFNSPFEKAFVFKCPTKYLFNWMNCPGCGTLRMMYSLMHGEVKSALSYNPAAFFLLPLLFWFILNNFTCMLIGREIRRAKLSVNANRLIIFGVIVYWVGRSI